MNDRPDGNLDALLENYDGELQQHGDSALGAGWPNEADRRTRFDVMLSAIDRSQDEPVTLCDFGCGTGELLGHIQRLGLKNIRYVGEDRSERALSLAREKFPDATFVQMDLTDPNAPLEKLACDYLVCSGLFLRKFDIPNEDMWSFLCSTVRRLWPHVRRAMAFNLMSTAVDWKRDDLFHVSMDDAARFMHELAGRNVWIRADYGLYEYTVFARRAGTIPDSGRRAIPVLHPQLPTTKHLLRYLPRIDRSRVYTDFGPLACEFEQRMSDALGLANGAFVSAGSGTAALAGAILATAGRADERTLAIIPAFTSAATASAVEQCGYEPYLADVDAETWMLDPQRLLSSDVLARVGLVVPVAPFGRPVPQAPWISFQEKTGVPVAIDGADSLDRVLGSGGAFLGRIPVAVSFHATKSFATGEGGGVITNDPQVAAEFRQSSGTLSEYHAAVGLAELDGWREKLAALQRVAERYRLESDRAGISERIVTTPDVSAIYVLFQAASIAQSRAIQTALSGDDIGFRIPNAARPDLGTTECLAATLIALPVAPDLDDDAIARIVRVVASAARE